MPTLFSSTFGDPWIQNVDVISFAVSHSSYRIVCNRSRQSRVITMAQTSRWRWIIKLISVYNFNFQNVGQWAKSRRDRDVHEPSESLISDHPPTDQYNSQYTNISGGGYANFPHENRKLQRSSHMEAKECSEG